MSQPMTRPVQNSVRQNYFDVYAEGHQLTAVTSNVLHILATAGRPMTRAEVREEMAKRGFHSTGYSDAANALSDLKMLTKGKVGREATWVVTTKGAKFAAKHLASLA